MFVIIGVAGELLADGGIFLFSSHLQTIADLEIGDLTKKARCSRRQRRNRLPLQPADSESEGMDRGERRVRDVSVVRTTLCVEHRYAWDSLKAACPLKPLLILQLTPNRRYGMKVPLFSIPSPRLMLQPD
jgi:hypothetical protein